MNKIILMGNLCRDPELKYSAAGKAYMQNCLAVRREFKRDGDPDADFINVTFFGKAAELIAQYLVKGSAVLVEGRLQIDVVDRDGSKRYYTKVPVSRFHFCGGKRKEGGGSGTALPEGDAFGADPTIGLDAGFGDDGADESPALPGGDETPDAPDFGSDVGFDAGDDGPTELPW